MSASNRTVTTLLTQRARPLLRDYGFSDFTGRKAWFVEDEVISHVTFNAVGSYFAGAVGCTSFSFSVEAGAFYRVFDQDSLRPNDYDMTFRLILGKYRVQALVHPDRPDIWFVPEDGQALDAVVDDAAQAVQRQALTWLDRFRKPQDAFDALLSTASTDADYGRAGMWMPGAPGSPRWTEVAQTIGAAVSSDAASRIADAPVLTRW